MFKKILILIVGVVFVASAANIYVNTSIDNGNLPDANSANRPINYKNVVISLADTTDTLDDGELRDTISTTNHITYGPIPLTDAPNSPRYLQFGVLAGGTNAADSFAVSYNLTRGAEISDTLGGNWVLCDSIKGAAGATQTIVDITDELGSYMFFKLHNYTATVSTIKEVLIEFKKNITYQQDM